MSFDTFDMASALPEATNGTGLAKLTEAELQEKGWTAKQAYNYDTAMAKPSDAPAEVDTGADGPFGWAHNAPKYEHDADLGEVGPKIPQLEEELFRSEFQNRRGVKFNE